ncbi:hypothetical protein [Bdellovibrio bacteriovorus]|uniref:hypothetical protein n=1 Tax=Bdellovibrio bacteriovorus TaxID=959 RepID=UPI003D057986
MKMFAFFLLSIVAFNSNAGSMTAKVRSVEGCSLDLSGIYISTEYKWSWGGDCPNSLAEGMNWLSRVSASGKKTRAYVIQMTKGKAAAKSLFAQSTHGWLLTVGSLEPVECLKGDARLLECDKINKFIISNSPYNTVRTEEGCQLVNPEVVPTRSHRWSGRCVKGMAQGYGYLRMTYISDQNTSLGEQFILMRFHEGKPLNGSFAFVEIKYPDGQRQSFNKYFDWPMYRLNDEKISPCSSIKACRELMAAKSAGGKDPLNMISESEMKPPGISVKAPAGSGSGMYGKGKYQAPVVACTDQAMNPVYDQFVKRWELDKPAAGICDGARKTAKLYEFYLNLLEGSCPGRYQQEVEETRESLRSAQRMVTQSCPDSSY